MLCELENYKPYLLISCHRCEFSYLISVNHRPASCHAVKKRVNQHRSRSIWILIGEVYIVAFNEAQYRYTRINATAVMLQCQVVLLLLRPLHRLCPLPLLLHCQCHCSPRPPQHQAHHQHHQNSTNYAEAQDLQYTRHATMKQTVAAISTCSAVTLGVGSAMKLQRCQTKEKLRPHILLHFRGVYPGKEFNRGRYAHK